MKKGVSIIIPTFQVPEYLSECINSILSQNINFNYEIIIGVDGCESTLNHINKNSDLFKKTKPYYFEDNSGPFVVKNNLIGKTKYQYILFFDSDDLMKDGMLQNFYNEIIDVDAIRFKYVELVNGTPKGGMKLAHGVLGVNRKIFEKVIGYENWRCAADTEFLERMSFNNFTTKTIENTSFFRRLHTKNLTIKSETNFSSKLRNGYVSILNKKRSTRSWTNPQIIIKECEKINFNDKI
jgi:glycosyltransferase involved in cell wall biosynthesis